MIGITFFGIIVLLVISIALFLSLSPQFGGMASKEQKVSYTKSGHYKNGKFVNRINSPVMSIPSWKLLKEFVKDAPNRKPRKEFSVAKIDSTDIVNHNSALTELTWFGHSAL